MCHTFRRYLLLAAALLVTCAMTMYGQSRSLVPARVLTTVNMTELTRLQGNAMVSKVATADLGSIDGSTQMSHMLLLLEPSNEQKQELTQLIAAQLDPTSLYFHKWLTPTEFGQRFGVAQADIDKVTAWLESNGFTVDEVAANHRVVVFSGTASQVSGAFHTSFHRYQMSQSVRIANDSDPQVPMALSPVIHGLVSLNDSERKPMHRSYGLFKYNAETKALTPVSVAADSVSPAAGNTGGVQAMTSVTVNSTLFHAVSPYDFAAIYNLKPVWSQGYDGTGQSIAIISPSDLNQSDVDSFRAQFGLPPTHMTKIYASTNPGITANVEETALDVEWSGAVAKGANIDLVIGAATLTTDGVDIASLYAVNNNVAPIISLSYGECEFYLGASGNAFYNALWEQAAAQGQSVFVASGDAGASTCEQGSYVSTLGKTVNGLGSTPYNVSVGGTDLYGTYTNTAAYWNSTNDSTTMASATGYIPEIPWNDSCGNPQLLGVLQAKKGFTETTTAALCGNATKITTSNYRSIVGGGGGASNCISTTDGTITGCTGGYPKPSWQAGSGVPADGVRDLPDVSLFAGDGLWGSFYLYCYSQATTTQTCDLSNSTNVQGAGGTSFATPAFAGIMAIINQKMGVSQGNPAPVFYALANTQTALNCNSLDGSASPSCIFHDVQAGSNAGACYYKSSTGARDCTVSSTSNTYGVVNGNAATAGYDLAIGLGSVDITNLVSNWSAVSLARNTTTTALTLSSKAMAYGSNQTASIAVSSASGTPTGDVSILPSSTAANAFISSPGTLAKGSATLSLSLLPVGSYTVKAHYAGDTNYLASDSATQSITVTQAATAMTASLSRSAITAGQTSMLSIAVSAAGAGLNPTGTVTVTDTTTGATLGTYTLTPSSTAVASAYNLSITPTSLVGGANTLTIAYSGDINYAASNTTATLTFSAPLALTLGSSALTLTTGTSASSVSTTLAVTAANGGSLSYPISLSCTGTLPNGASCNLSQTLLTSPATSATVSVGFTPPAAEARLEQPNSRFSAKPLLFLGFGFLLLLRRKNRIFLSLSVVMMACAGMLSLAACSSSPAITSYVSLSSSSTTVAQGSPLTLTSTVNYANTNQNATLAPVAINDMFRGANHLLGSITFNNTSGITATGTLSTSALGIGTHLLTASYTGQPGSISNTLTVNVTNSSTLAIHAVDANGYAVTAPLGVTLQ